MTQTARRTLKSLFRSVSIGSKRGGHATCRIVLLLVTALSPAASKADNIARLETWDYPSFLQQQVGSSQEKRLPTPEPGSPVAFDIASGDSHFFRIDFADDTYLHLIVSSRRINVTVALLGADGTQFFEVDSTRASAGEESLHFVAEASGTYQIKVGAAGGGGGSYQFFIKQLRAALPEDRRHAAATRTAAEGGQLRKLAQELVEAEKGEEAAAKYQEAAAKYQEAAVLWRQVSETKEEGKALYNCGLLYAQVDEHARAREFYAQALQLVRAHGTSEEHAAVAINLGISNLDAGEVYVARRYFEEALPLFEKETVARGMAFTLGELGRASYLLGENQEALSFYQRALDIWRSDRIPDEKTRKRGEAFTRDLIGRVQFSLGERSESLKSFEAALALFAEIKIDSRSHGNTLLDLGRYHLTAGDGEKALSLFKEAFRLFGDHNPSGRAEALAYIGDAHTALKSFPSAIENLDEALSLQRRLNDLRGQGDTLHKLGVTYHAAGDRAQAIEHLEKALAHWQTNKYRPGEAQTRYEISRVAGALGDLEKARAQIESAVRIVESQRAGVISDRLRVSYFASVQDYYEQYVHVLMQLHARAPQGRLDKLALNVNERARARALLEALWGSRHDIRNGVANPGLLSEEKRLRQQLSSSADLQIRLLSKKLSPTEEGKVRRQLAAIEGRLREIEEELRVRSPRYAQLFEPRLLTSAEIQAEILDEETLLLEYALGEPQSYLWVVSDTDVRALELPGRAYIESLAKPFRELVAKRNVEARERETRDRLARELGSALLGPAALLLGEKRLLVVADEVLQFIPFAALQVPAAEGRAGETGVATTNRAAFEPLVAGHEIVYEISASTLAAIRREQAGRKPSPLGVAIIADPVLRHKGVGAGPSQGGRGRDTAPEGGAGGTPFPSGAADKAGASAAATKLTPSKNAPIPPLLFSGEEARTIYKLARPRARLLNEFKANKEAVIGPELSRYRIVHFSTHALLNNDQPNLSGIVLSLVDRQGRPQDGFLQLYEIYNLRLPADLIVLSACQTAIGTDVKGEGMIGLTRGFIYAGSQRVASTLWEVDDQATAELMSQFYKNMLGGEGRSPAASLRQAQLALLRRRDRWSDPFYWAGFVMQGEWKKAPSGQPARKPRVSRGEPPKTGAQGLAARR